MSFFSYTASIELITIQYLVWPLYEKYGHAFDAFKLFVSDPSLLETECVECKKLSEEASEILIDPIISALLKDIRRRMTPQPLKIRADVELSCFEYDGIMSIKNAMRAAELVSTEDCKVKMSLVASPLYVLSTQTSERETGIRIIDEAVKVLQVRLVSQWQDFC